MRFNHSLLALVFSALWLAGPVPAARADAPLSRPFAPWMKFDNSVKSDTPALGANGHKAILARPSGRASEKSPDSPVLTPDDTRQLIEEIYSPDSLEGRSALEDFYSRRIVDEVEQFGYDLFGTPGDKEEKASNSALPAGAVQDDFLLNIGDRLNISFRGQRDDSKVYTIDGQGLLIVDGMQPLSAAGRTMGQLRDDIQAQTEALHNTKAFIALESVRQVNVLVVGHVKKPGRKTLTVFHTVLDALMEADGVEKTGSLRQIKLVRNGRGTIVDLYSLLIHGSPIMDISLRDGDRIIIPPVGPTVAVAGAVKRPGIYEILPAMDADSRHPGDKSQTLSLQDLLDMSGGILNPGKNRFMLLKPGADGREKVTEIHDPLQAAFTDGSIALIAPSDEKRTGTVELRGQTRESGIHSIDETPTLAGLLDSEDVLGPDIYPLIGVIERWNSDQLAMQMIAFPPLLAVKGRFDRKLRDGDVVHLFSREQIRALQEQDFRQAEDTEESGSAKGTGDTGIIDDPGLTAFLRERQTFVRGAVRDEGGWPVAEGLSLDNLIAVAGGATLEASTGNIEVTHKPSGEPGPQRRIVDLASADPSSVMIGPGDSVRVNQKFRKVSDSSVLIIGEVAHPGRYDLTPGDRMSDLLRRAGGVTAQAYPDGAIFSRDSERKAEEARFRAQAQELEMRLAAALEDKDADENPENIATVRELVAQLKQAEGVGRITVEADPSMLTTQPELDILLESGDRVYVPARPLTVRVAGEILSPASLQFRKDKSPRDYIAEAGGFGYNADRDRVFVLYPDGSAQPLAVNAWNHSPALIPPGSTIVVPRDPEPFDFVQTAKDVSQIISNLAITGIFIDDLRNGD